MARERVDDVSIGLGQSKMVVAREMPRQRRRFLPGDRLGHIEEVHLDWPVVRFGDLRGHAVAGDDRMMRIDEGRPARRDEQCTVGRCDRKPVCIEVVGHPDRRAGVEGAQERTLQVRSDGDQPGLEAAVVQLLGRRRRATTRAEQGENEERQQAHWHLGHAPPAWAWNVP